MYTPKHTSYHAPQRDVSPLRSSSSKGKLYSAEQINKMMKTVVQPKINYLRQQLDERQRIIAALNQKLNQNDMKLLNQRNLIQNLLKKQRQNPQVQAFIIGTINQLLNDKTKQYWETISAQMKQINRKIQQEFDLKKYEFQVQTQIQNLRKSVNQEIDKAKNKSNAYWLKIKQALNKINSKISSNQKELTDIHVKLQNEKGARQKDRQMVNELQNGRRIIKNLIELKKSVNNLYQNYQSILSLQKGFRNQLESRDDDEYFTEMAQNGRGAQNTYNKQKNQKKFQASEELITLQYSKEEHNLQEMQHQYIFSPPRTQQIVSPTQALEHEQQFESKELLTLQKTTPLGKTYVDHSQIFSLNTSNNANSRFNQNSTLLINLSLQTRNEMSQGIRDRLIELIDVKGLRKPLQIMVDDQINYLKSAEGNYLFDVKGNMFKTNENELNKLQQQGIIRRQRTKKSKSLKPSDVKKTHC